MKFNTKLCKQKPDETDVNLDNVLGDNVGVEFTTTKTTTSGTDPKDEAAKKAAENAARIEAENKAKADAEAAAKAAADAAKATGATGDEGKGDEPKKVTIDEIECTVDKDGNAIKPDGTIYKTKVEIDAILAAEADAAMDVVGKIQKSFGYEFKDATGNPKVYEDTPEGIIAYNKDVLDHLRKIDQQNFLNQNPRVAKYAKAVQAGITDEGFFTAVPKIDWNKTVLDKTNTEQLKNVVVSAYKAQGVPEDTALMLAGVHKEKEELDTKADWALEFLKKDQVAKEEKLNKDIADNQARKQKEDDDYWTEVETVVKAGKVKDLVIPDADRINFLRYISADVTGKGQSQASIDQSKEDLHTNLMIAYYRFKKYDLSALVKAGVSTAKAKTLKEQYAEAAEKARNNGSGKTTTVEKGTIDDINLNTLLN